MIFLKQQKKKISQNKKYKPKKKCCKTKKIKCFKKWKKNEKTKKGFLSKKKKKKKGKKKRKANEIRQVKILLILENSTTFCPILEPPVNNKSVKCIADCVAVTDVASFYALIYRKKILTNIIMALPWETHGILKKRKKENKCISEGKYLIYVYKYIHIYKFFLGTFSGPHLETGASQ